MIIKRIWCKGTELTGFGDDCPMIKHKTWANGSGRATTGLSTGRVAYWKYSVSLKFPFIPSSDFDKMENIFETEPQYFPVKVIDGNDQTHNLTMYAGDLSYSSITNCGKGEIWYRGVSVELVEE
ncbi:MAG: hypothetical protein IJ031_00100 [Oscillospiraceae bacterium]|nr:hypothetical protein [Oscillospiraceae bacterium]MBQ8377683.1 hypothetical protein [Oscillospiraceae bacterium]MBQ8882990.1 hypothetical protein [Oscillospiraceae bacterium]